MKPFAVSSEYLMGHDDRERNRLSLQSTILNPNTEELLRSAGVSSGMRVFDIGCGVGETTMLAARLVGPQGHVTAIDMDPVTIERARRNAQEQGIPNITFLVGNVVEHSQTTEYDATLGRFVLIHVPEPLQVVRKAFSLLRSGGVSVFCEPDSSLHFDGFPELPLQKRVAKLFRDVLMASTHGDIGKRLYQLFVNAGFRLPQCRVDYLLDGGADSLYYAWYAESLRTLLPKAVTLGIASATDFALDTLEERLREEAVNAGGCVPAAIGMVGGYARKP